MWLTGSDVLGVVLKPCPYSSLLLDHHRSGQFDIDKSFLLKSGFHCPYPVKKACQPRQEPYSSLQYENSTMFKIQYFSSHLFLPLSRLFLETQTAGWLSFRFINTLLPIVCHKVRTNCRSLPSSSLRVCSDRKSVV